MPSRVRIRTTARPRRSHAERTAETKQRVKAAVVECIAERGYPRTTGSEIARRAGVSWGAVQHHFGDKNGILAAVLEESFDGFAAVLGEPDSSRPIEERVSTFIARAWAHFRSDQYRTTFEILLNLPPDMEASWALGVLKTWRAIWRRHFPDSALSERQTTELMHYAVSVLSGLATTRMLEGRTARVGARGLGFLEETLVAHLSGRASR